MERGYHGATTGAFHQRTKISSWGFVPQTEYQNKSWLIRPRMTADDDGCYQR